MRGKRSGLHAGISAWERLASDIAGCERCPRLRAHCTEVARTRRAAFAAETYWGRPIPNLGEASGHLLIIGLAPAAHGANRTGRMFTGDRSGDFLFEAMHATGFASQATSTHAADGLQLIDCAITATAHCAPPENKPTVAEVATCQPFLDRTVEAMPVLARGSGGILVLGKIAFDAAIGLYRRRGWLPARGPRGGLALRFAHGALHKIPDAPFLLCTYHPSQQNTFTGRLTQGMLQAVFTTARHELDRPAVERERR